jgi:hypothetical protein
MLKVGEVSPLFTSRPCNNEEQNLMRKTQRWGGRDKRIS